MIRERPSKIETTGKYRFLHKDNNSDIKTFVQPQPVDMPDISPEQSKKIKESIKEYMYMQELLKYIDDIKRFCELQIQENDGCDTCPFSERIDIFVQNCTLYSIPKDWDIKRSEILNKYKPSGYMHKYNKNIDTNNN